MVGSIQLGVLPPALVGLRFRHAMATFSGPSLSSISTTSLTITP